MKSLKKLFAGIAVAAMLATAGTAIAATFKTPAEIVTDVTSKTAQEVTQERASGKTYGTIANEAGKLEEFKTEMLKQRKDYLNQLIKDGKLTQAQADQMYARMENNQLNCSGTGCASPGMRSCGGLGNGQKQGFGQGRGQGMGQGFGAGQGAGRTAAN